MGVFGLSRLRVSGLAKGLAGRRGRRPGRDAVSKWKMYAGGVTQLLNSVNALAMQKFATRVVFATIEVGAR